MFPLNHLQQITQPEYKSGALTDFMYLFIYFPFCTKE